jgi:group I intron endonuclease
MYNKEENMLYIYLTENLVNGKLYVGKHSGEVDDGYLGSGKILKLAIMKHGIENFRKIILAVAENEDELDRLEVEYVKKYREIYGKKLYNLTDGGTGGNTCRYLPSDVVSRTRSGWFEKMLPEEQEKLRQLKSEQMKSQRQDPIKDQQRIEALKKTLSNKTEEETKADYDNRRGIHAPNRKSVKTPLGIFNTLTAAAKAHKVAVTTVANRCNYPHFDEWEWI